MDRRSFVCGVTCLAMGSTLQNLASRAGAASGTPPKLKIGFLGAAYSHAAPKLALLRAHPESKTEGEPDK